MPQAAGAARQTAAGLGSALGNGRRPHPPLCTSGAPPATPAFDAAGTWGGAAVAATHRRRRTAAAAAAAVLAQPRRPSCALAPAGMGLIRGLIHEAVDAISGDKVAAPQPQARSAPAANGADDKVTKE